MGPVVAGSAGGCRLPRGRLCPLQLLPSPGPARGHRELACPLDCRGPRTPPAPARPHCHSGPRCRRLQHPPLCCAAGFLSGCASGSVSQAGAPRWCLSQPAPTPVSSESMAVGERESKARWPSALPSAVAGHSHRPSPHSEGSSRGPRGAAPMAHVLWAPLHCGPVLRFLG